MLKYEQPGRSLAVLEIVCRNIGLLSYPCAGFWPEPPGAEGEEFRGGDEARLPC